MTQNLYIINCQGFYKIGVAADIESRLAQLSTGNPFPLKVEVLYKFDNADPIERALHQRYKDCRERGEWFRLSYDDLKNIHRVCLDLGGRAFEYDDFVTDEEIEEAEEMAELPDGGKWDFAAMFADGWRMEVSNENGNPRNWIWRRKSGEKRRSLYGGMLSSLPLPIEELREMYRDTK